MLNIIHFSQDFTTGKRQLGAYGRILNLANDSNNHIIFTLGVGGQTSFTEYQINQNITVIQLPITFNNIRLFKRYFFVKRISKSIKLFIQQNGICVDILFGHSQIINYYILKKLNLNKPLIWEMNAVWGVNTPKGIKTRITIAYLKFLEKSALKSADGIVFQTESALNWVKKFYGINDLKNKSIVVNNGFGGNVLSKSAKHEVKVGTYKVLINGLFDDLNGSGFLYNYLKKNKISDVELHFYGHGKWFQKLKSLDDKKNIFVNDAVQREVMLEIYDQFDFILIPRLKGIQSDLFIPSKLIEAMGFGLVPIVTDVNGMTEVVTSQEGFILEPESNSSLKNILLKIPMLPRHEWLEYSIASMSKIKNDFSWDKIHISLQKFYNSILNKSENQIP